MSDGRACASAAEAVKQQLHDNWLSLLPTEILLLIFRMLPSQSLLVLEKLGDSRISALTCDRNVISSVDFSRCSHLTSLVDFKGFFRSVRARAITELNFNHCGWIGTKNLMSCIVKCKNVRVLSIRDCGFSFEPIITVFQKAENLLSLDWTVDMDNCERHHISTLGKFTSVKNLQRLRLDFINCTDIIVKCCYYFLRNCTALKELSFYVVINNVSDLVYHRLVLMPPVEPNVYVSKDLESFIVVFDAKNQSHRNMITVHRILHDLAKVIFSSTKPDKWKSIWLDDSFYECRIVDELIKQRSLTLQHFNSASCVRIKGPNTYMQVLRCVPKNNLHSLCIENVVLSAECFANLAPIVGNKLERLQIKKSVLVGRLQLATLLPTVFENCTNITEINFFGTHTFLGDTPCSALSALKGLKRVLLMSCHVKRILKQAANVSHLQGLRKRKRVPPQPEVVSHPFRVMIENCSLVEEVHIMHCGEVEADSDHKSCDEDDIASIFLWKNLKVLLLSRLESLSSLSCLRNIAIHCKRFESLNIDYVGNDTVIPNLCSLFTSSESLQTVRITHSRLHLTKPFWASLGNAKNLKNLCLATGFWDRVENDVVLESLAKLKHLELFHFISSISNVPKLTAAIKTLWGCDSKKKDQRAELRKRELTVKKINSQDSAMSHHTCSLEIYPFSTGIGNPLKP